MRRKFSRRETTRYRRWRALDKEYEALRRIRDAHERHTMELIARGERFAKRLRKLRPRDSLKDDLWSAAAYWAQIKDKRAMKRLDAALCKMQRLRQLTREGEPRVRARLFELTIGHLVEMFEWIHAVTPVADHDSHRLRFLRLVAEIVHDAEEIGLIGAGAR